MNSATPTMPSLPTAADPAVLPFSIRYSSDTSAVVGRITWVSRSPASYSTWPKGMSKGARCGCQRCQVSSGRAASNRFWRGSP